MTVALTEALHVAIPDELRRSAILAGETTSPATPPGALSLTPAFPPKRKRGGNPLVTISIIALALLLATGYGMLLLLTQREATTSNQLAGYAFFMNSGQLNEQRDQGINDELQVDLSSIPNPPPGKSYYAWLLGDIGQTEAVPIFLGRLTIEHGTVHFLYAGDGHHANLLGFTSRFPVEQSAAGSEHMALLRRDPPNPQPGRSLALQHARSPAPSAGVPGAHHPWITWRARVLVRQEYAAVSDLTNSLSEDWQKQDANAIHDQIVRILDYLDGLSFVMTDVPPGTPLLADEQDVQVALLGPSPQDAGPPGYVYQNEAPPGYVYLIEAHMDGAILSPQVTAKQRQLALRITGDLDSVKHSLAQIAQDARQLVRLTKAQVLQPAALTLLNDLATQAQYAYTGRPDPSTGASQGGVIWICDNPQRLATFDVAPYSAP